ncbi:putative serine/threonine protein kinase [Brazilian marseillevirus]|uniref:putative serine/threonine protein kinase n=1 Tax=Brazilian marseillevirus TaxID=1813599 RepID=UPI000782DE41|nr:putative serine/threonine protein kinase [Brazilian marseillevirus]AMQ10823.1 putative serine/threonine protein kinase [Brazilian marseillevirus]
MLQQVHKGIIETPDFPEFSQNIIINWLRWKAQKLGIPVKEVLYPSDAAVLFTDVSSAVLKEPLIKHSKLEGWVVHKKLGQGSYGSVYKATDPTGKVFALKMFPVNIVESDVDEKELQMLDEDYTSWGLKEYWDVFLGLEEEKALKVIEGSREKTSLLMQSYAYGVTSFATGIYVFAVIEYIEGTSLTELIHCARDTKWIPTQQVFEKFASVLFQGVSQLHSIGLAHLDINPNNIMFTGTQLNLVDFGFACIFLYGKERQCLWSQSTINPPEFTFYAETKTRKQAEAIDVWCSAFTILSLLSISEFGRVAQENREDETQNKKDLERRLKVAKEKYTLPPLFLEALDDDPMKRPTASQIHKEFDRLL